VIPLLDKDLDHDLDLDHRLNVNNPLSEDFYLNHHKRETHKRNVVDFKPKVYLTIELQINTKVPFGMP
jgi:hypothetical protein